MKRTTLATVASQTGGVSVVNDDDLEGGLNRIMADLDHYYVLGFSPADTASRGFRPVTVQMKRPD